jgi:hypothetical protein
MANTSFSVDGGISTDSLILSPSEAALGTVTTVGSTGGFNNTFTSAGGDWVSAYDGSNGVIAVSGVSSGMRAVLDTITAPSSLSVRVSDGTTTAIYPIDSVSFTESKGVYSYNINLDSSYPVFIIDPLTIIEIGTVQEYFIASTNSGDLSSLFYGKTKVKFNSTTFNTSQFSISASAFTSLNSASVSVGDVIYLLNENPIGFSATKLNGTNVSVNFNQSSEKWQYTNDGSTYQNILTINALDDIGDISASSPSTGEVLAWNGSSWVNKKNIAELTNTNISSGAQTTIASFNKDTANASEFAVSVKQGDRFLSTKVLLSHNNLTADIANYGELLFPGSLSFANGGGAVAWTTRTSGFGNYAITSIEYGNNVWVAAGSVGRMSTSTDTVTWTTRTSNFGNQSITSVAYGNNLWVAAAGFGELRTSTDAITWTTQTSNFGTTTILSVAYGNNLWVAAGVAGELRTSTDAITWTTQTSNFQLNIQSVAYGNSLWVAIGQVGQLRTSTDAVTWVTRNSNFGNTHIDSVSYGNGIWVAAGSYGQLRTSTDGTTWTTQTSNFGNLDLINQVKSANNIWVAVGDSGQLRTSTEAANWTTQTSNYGNSRINSIAFGKN